MVRYILTRVTVQLREKFKIMKWTMDNVLVYLEILILIFTKLSNLFFCHEGNKEGSTVAPQ